MSPSGSPADRLQIAFFGSSLVSAYWNGAATYYRGIVRALAGRGHRVTFYEPDAFDRQEHRDIPDPDWARVVVYPGSERGALTALASARDADLVIKASGVGVNDELLERAVVDLRGRRTRVAFWDVDAPATLDRMRADAADPLRAVLPEYDLVFTYGGGPPVVRAYLALGARACLPIYNAVDPDVHHPVPPDQRFAADLSFLGNRLPDREARVDEFFMAAAAAAPELRFLLGGAGWDDRARPDNVRYVGHVYTADHNAFNASARAVLNISRDSMARYGHSPATRVFEAAGAGACLITDAWDGIEQFLAPGTEVLVAESGADVARHVRMLGASQARAIGERARARVLAEHTYAHRAVKVEQALGLDRPAPRARAASRGEASDRMRIVVLGLSITSSWGNGHATTYRALVRELCRRGHDLLFLERDRPWYAANRDLPRPPYGRTALYDSLVELDDRYRREVAEADLVVVGSFVLEGAEVGRWVQAHATGITAFYDIDTPVTMARLRDGECDYLAPDLVPGYQLYLSFTGGPILRHIERALGSPCAVPLYCSVSPEQYSPAGARPERDLGYMGTYSADRQPGLDELLLAPARGCPDRRFVVAGPMYPAELTWPDNVDRVEHLAPPEHPAFYGGQRFTLNLTRADMRRAGYAPSVRLFEAAACATPIISDEWRGIETFFQPGREILIARTTLDVMAYLGGMGDDERRALGERARAAVLARHTALHRAVELEGYVARARDASAGRPGPRSLAGGET
jgi:spore maturation protein CgeB